MIGLLVLSTDLRLRTALSRKRSVLAEPLAGGWKTAPSTVLFQHSAQPAGSERC